MIPSAITSNAIGKCPRPVSICTKAATSIDWAMRKAVVLSPRALNSWLWSCTAALYSSAGLKGAFSSRLFVVILEPPVGIMLAAYYTNCAILCQPLPYSSLIEGRLKGRSPFKNHSSPFPLSRGRGIKRAPSKIEDFTGGLKGDRVDKQSHCLAMWTVI